MLNVPKIVIPDQFNAATVFLNLYFPIGVGASAVHYAGRPLPEDMFNVEILPELPKTATGKIQRFILRGM